MYRFAEKPKWLLGQSFSRGMPQAKLKVNAPGDSWEQEADQAASGASRARRLSAVPQHTAGSLEDAPAIVMDALQTGGRPLDLSAQMDMESHFGHRFGDVRIHTDAKASAASRAVNALAYTVGRDVVFGEGMYAPSTGTGRRLLAHELAHVVQQGSTPAAPLVQRATFFGPTSGAPSDWATKVAAATTSADKAALVQTATGLTVNDATSASSSDASPTAAHLVEYSASSEKINYDENLNTKTSPVDARKLSLNAGYTLHSSGKHYVVLGPKSIDADRYYLTMTIVNHEFDHIRQDIAGSTLKGNESELDAWTTSFIRDFHRTYLLGDTGTTCYVQSVNTWTPLLDYYHRKDVSTAQGDACARRIKTYYDTTIKVHDGHKAAFRYWVYSSMKRGITPSLADRLNTDLGLGLSTSDSAASIRQFPCGTLKSLTYSAPTLDKPTFPTPKPTPTPSP